MKDLIIIHGPSGIGKTVLAQGLKAVMEIRFAEKVTVFDNFCKRDGPANTYRIQNELGHIIVTTLDMKDIPITLRKKATRVISISRKA